MKDLEKEKLQEIEMKYHTYRKYLSAKLYFSEEDISNIMWLIELVKQKNQHIEELEKHIKK